MAPAFQAGRAAPQSVIKSAAAASSGMATRSALVVFEFALTLSLVIGAGILSRSYVRLTQVNPGFGSRGVLTLRILVPPSRKPELLFHLMQQKLLSLPGVQAFAVTNALPLIANRANASRFNVPGSPLINPDALPTAQIRTVSPDYFQAMKISLRSGRVFTERDLNQAVVVINETMAKRFWPGRDPVGLKFITGPWGPDPTWSIIVGVVANVKQFGLDSEASPGPLLPQSHRRIFDRKDHRRSARTCPQRRAKANSSCDRHRTGPFRCPLDGPNRRLNRPATLDHGLSGDLCGAGLLVGACRNLRRDVMVRGATHPGVRNSPGFWHATGSPGGTGSVPRIQAGHCRIGIGNSGLIGPAPIPEQSGVRCEYGRSADLYFGTGFDAGGCTACLLYPGAAGERR